MAHEYGARCAGGRWLLSIVLILTSIMNGSGEYGEYGRISTIVPSASVNTGEFSLVIQTSASPRFVY